MDVLNGRDFMELSLLVGFLGEFGVYGGMLILLFINIMSLTQASTEKDKTIKSLSENLSEMVREKLETLISRMSTDYETRISILESMRDTLHSIHDIAESYIRKDKK